VSTVKLTVNGKAVSADVEDRTLLVNLLRDHLNLQLRAIAAGGTAAGLPARLTDRPARLPDRMLVRAPRGLLWPAREGGSAA